MEKERLTAFSDGVIAVIITIMVLELKVPSATSWGALHQALPGFLSYLLSFLYVAIYWNNHHHLLYGLKRVNGAILWANMHLLFWLSLIPWSTAWAQGNYSSTAPTALFGGVLLMAAIAFFILQRVIIKTKAATPQLESALGRDFKEKISTILYALAVGSAFIYPPLSYFIYTFVAALWLIPDRRIESKFSD